MFVHLYFFIMTCLISSVCTDKPCESWKDHRNFHLVHFQDDCGKARYSDDSISSRIFNGRRAVPGSLPWMAFIYIKPGGEEGFKCGGSIINDRYVLTAAHCFKKSNITAIVVVGLYDELDISRYIYGDEYAYNVTSIVKHLDYQKEQDGQNKNDIALLRVERKISFESPHVNYICLPASCDYVTTAFRGKNLLMAGWGETSPNKDATFLQIAELTVNECENRGTEPDDESQLCTKTNTAKTCFGDSGGPLMHSTFSQFYQIGILSTGYGECAADQHMRNNFMKVSYFMTWILDNIKP